MPPLRRGPQGRRGESPCSLRVVGSEAVATLRRRVASRTPAVTTGASRSTPPSRSTVIRRPPRQRWVATGCNGVARTRQDQVRDGLDTHLVHGDPSSLVTESGDVRPSATRSSCASHRRPRNSDEVFGNGVNRVEFELLQSRPRTGSALDVGHRRVELSEVRLRRHALHVKRVHHDTASRAGLFSFARTRRRCRHWRRGRVRAAPTRDWRCDA